MLALFLDNAIDLTFGLLVHFLYLGGLDAAVSKEHFEGGLRNLAADRVERGDSNGVRRVIDDHFYTGHTLKKALILRPSSYQILILPLELFPRG